MPLDGARIIFVCAPSRAYGEINVLIPLATAAANAGAEVWFLVSPLAAGLAEKIFPNRVFVMTNEREVNQTLLYRMVRKFRPDLVAFAELYEILKPRRVPDCPLFDSRMLEWFKDFDTSLAFVDFIAHTPALREVANCPECADRFGSSNLHSFFSRLWVILPCPLHEPSSVAGRRGIPFRTMSLPIEFSLTDRRKTRERFLGKGQADKAHLVVRTGSTWQSKMAEKAQLPIFDYLPDLFSYYLTGLRKPVTLVSVSSEQQLGPAAGLNIVNIPNLTPLEFDRLLLAADVLITDNEIGYTQAKAVGRVPSVVFVNSQTAEAILMRLPEDQPVGRIVREVQRDHPEAIYPHRIFPIRDEPWAADMGASDPTEATTPSVMRLNGMVSSPHYKAELYGGAPVRDLFRALLDDPATRRAHKQNDAAYMRRLNELPDGGAVIARLLEVSAVTGNSVL